MDHAALDAATKATRRAQLVRERPDWAHDMSALRRESIRRALLAAGDDPALAGLAFEHFYAERNRVELFEDALPALERLARRWPIVAVSNGNADLERVGLSRFFAACFSAHQFGVGKPAAPIFHAACAAVGAPPDAVLHVGDDAELDVDGALAAGLRAAWVQRPGQAGMGGPQRMPQGTPHHHVTDLTALADQLGA